MDLISLIINIIIHSLKEFNKFKRREKEKIASDQPKKLRRISHSVIIFHLFFFLFSFCYTERKKKKKRKLTERKMRVFVCACESKSFFQHIKIQEREGVRA
jgi:hypothetical protein